MQKWKEEVEKLTSDINPIQRLVFMAWIQKEIIEKIIEDIPDEIRSIEGYGDLDITHIKDQLRAKFL